MEGQMVTPLMWPLLAQPSDIPLPLIYPLLVCPYWYGPLVCPWSEGYLCLCVVRVGTAVLAMAVVVWLLPLRQDVQGLAAVLFCQWITEQWYWWRYNNCWCCHSMMMTLNAWRWRRFTNCLNCLITLAETKATECYRKITKRNLLESLTTNYRMQ